MKATKWLLPAVVVAGAVVIALAQASPKLIATVPLWSETSGQMHAGWIDVAASNEQLALLSTAANSNNRVPAFLCASLPTSWKASVWRNNSWQNQSVAKLELKLLQSGGGTRTLTIEPDGNKLKWTYGATAYSCSTATSDLPAEFAAALYSAAPMSADGYPARWSSFKFP